MNRSFSTTPGTFFQHHLNCFKRPPVNDGFMGVFYNDPLRLGKPNRLFGLITHLFMPPLHHISDIKLIVQHLVYRGATPKVCIGIFRCNMVMDAMLLFISSWAWNFSSFRIRAILCAPIPLRAIEKIRLTTSAASGSMISFPFAFGSLQYPYRAKEPMNKPSFLLWSSTERTLVDKSSRYHSLISH